MNLLETTITSDRLRMAPTSYARANDIYTEFTPEIAEHMTASAPARIAETYGYIRTSLSRMRNGEYLGLSIFGINSDEYLGQSGLHRIDTPTPEIGLWIKKEAQGNGYGSETVRALMQWCNENLDFQYITYPVTKTNDVSRKIVESVGGIEKRELKREKDDGSVLDEVEYWIYSA